MSLDFRPKPVATSSRHGLAIICQPRSVPQPTDSRMDGISRRRLACEPKLRSGDQARLPKPPGCDRTSARETSGANRVLLVVDQWEELYTLTSESSIRQRFIDLLLDTTAHAPLSIVLTLRGDFVGDAIAYRPLADAMQGAQVNVGAMTRDELRRAIETPSRGVGLQFESGLVSRILD